jgi:hypothetical protein
MILFYLIFTFVIVSHDDRFSILISFSISVTITITITITITLIFTK